jgi:hypothetical protein
MVTLRPWCVVLGRETNGRDTVERISIYFGPRGPPAFHNEAAAKRAAKKEWAAQPAGERVSYVLAKAAKLLEPDYGVDVHEEPLDEAE